MFKITHNIKSLYDINLVEGEGVGTAYEYYAKLMKLRVFINSIKRPRRILIAGLPEKYGLSMDFFLLGQMLQAEVVAIDERPEALKRARNALYTMKSRGLLDDKKVIFLKVDQLAKFDEETFLEGRFDLALSSEVFQRLDEGQSVYISNLKSVATHFAVFVPNRGNESHANRSGLRSLYLAELLKYCQEGRSRASIFDYGYIDMPPFPPGLSRSHNRREQAARSSLEAFLMKGLQTYSLFEDVLPTFVKRKMAHIVYVIVTSP